MSRTLFSYRASNGQLFEVKLHKLMPILCLYVWLIGLTLLGLNVILTQTLDLLGLVHEISAAPTGSIMPSLLRF